MMMDVKSLVCFDRTVRKQQDSKVQGSISENKTKLQKSWVQG